MTMRRSLERAMGRSTDGDIAGALREDGLAIANEDSMTQAVHAVYCDITADHDEPSEKDRDQARKLLVALQAYANH